MFDDAADFNSVFSYKNHISEDSVCIHKVFEQCRKRNDE